jgi:capsid protein
MGLLSAVRDWIKPAPKQDANERVRATVAAMQNLMHRQRATYDAARTSPEFQNYWANSDAFDADSANNRAVRLALIHRQRYELANNGYSDGIIQTYATDVVGTGPSLRMQTNSPNFNALVENTWFNWTQATLFRRKLWCMAHAKCCDGEAFGNIVRNPKINHPVNLDIQLHEADQYQTPFLPFGIVGYIDGLKFDEFENREWWDMLPQHPGMTNRINFDSVPDRIPADRVLQWYKLRRPGQHRGVPEMASTLNLGGAFRRLREANLGTAEKVAAWTLFLKTMFQPSDEDIQPTIPMTELGIVHGMMTALPNSVEPVQLKAEHPGPTYDAFHKTLLNEQARPKNMPYNKAACDSSSYNYASGRLDHQTYYAALDVDREDCNDLVLDPFFSIWMDFAIKKFGWLGGDPEAVGSSAKVHLWDWPKHQVADVEAEANANSTKLKTGQIDLDLLWSQGGFDLEEATPRLTKTFGVTEDELRRRLFDVILVPPKQMGPTGGATPQVGPPPGSAPATTGGFNGQRMNGAIHAN